MIAAGIGLRNRFPAKDDPVYGTYKDLVPFGIAIPAAWLGYAFQRRASYLQALRGVFQEIVQAVNAAVEYTRWDAVRSEADFRKTMEQLSTAIDTLRGVFENVPQKEYPLGLYPYESLKDIRSIVGWLGYGERWRTEKDRAHECIAKLWVVMHSALLNEFDRAVPIVPISKYLGNQIPLADKLIDGTLNEKADFQQSDIQRDQFLAKLRKRW
jgi:hypothetical protein